jgi:hypothetical protein
MADIASPPSATLARSTSPQAGLIKYCRSVTFAAARETNASKAASHALKEVPPETIFSSEAAFTGGNILVFIFFERPLLNQ